MTRRPLSRRPVSRLGVAAGLTTALLLSGCQAPVANTPAEAGTSGPVAESSASEEAVAVDAPRLASADNFRDVAGIDTAYPVADGHLRPGVVYRSNALTLSDEDLATLESMAVATVIDLRTEDEIAENPDRVPEGADYVNVDIIGQASSAADLSAEMTITTPEDSADMLREANIAFATDEGMRDQFGTVLRTIAESDGPVIVHCTAGKDRAGWTAALPLAAGADEHDVMANYLATNDFTAQRIEETTEQIREAKGDEAAAAYAVLLGVEDSFLRAGLDEMTTEFGGIDGYLEDGLGLDRETLEKLRGKLIET